MSKSCSTCSLYEAPECWFPELAYLETHCSHYVREGATVRAVAVGGAGMSGLSGADVALAVAPIIGKNCRASQSVGCMEMWEVPFNGVVKEFPGDAWRPDLGGAAGAEVLDWAYANIPGFQLPERAGLTAGFDFEAVISEESNYRTLYGDTVWIALCRAVVAWKEALS